jgi:hypothetical protein
MASMEERERRLAEERVLTALRLQRKQRLEALVRKRKDNLKYLQVQTNTHIENLTASLLIRFFLLLVCLFVW